VNGKARGRPRHADQLTPAEWKVAEAVRHGLSNPQIAQRQNVSVDAVKFHVGNVLAKLGLASRLQLRLWRGISRASALSKSLPKHPRQESSAMTEPAPLTLGPLGQVARTVADIEAARRWYGEVLGLPHLYSFGPLAFFDCAGTRLMLSAGEAKATGPAANSILYFRVGDIHAAQKALTARGVEFTHAPHMIHRHADGTEEWMAFFNDPDGQPLALMAQVAHAS
jgi:DNA-binding CsgD family transcriptional regulator/catechol 2,3-dioxygenase-like lactoylglutathione lyase family enzyme